MNPSMFPCKPVLIVEDELETMKSYAIALRIEGIKNIVQCSDSRDVLSLLGEREIGVILMDLIMPHIRGEDLLPRINKEFPEIPVIILTGIDEVDKAVACMKQGALDYMVKPVEKSRLVSGVKRAIEIMELRDENKLLKEHMLSGVLQNSEAFLRIVTKNSRMFSIFQYVESIAKSNQPVLVTGETGVGKELMVHAVHATSGQEGPLVPVNVSGVDDSIFSDTLFGHVKGAFTGAGERRKGLVERASQGTLYLDEIGDLRMKSQVKLLRLLQEREYYPLGSDVSKAADVRVIVTTNRDLNSLQESGEFRKDLYYRLCTHQVHIPPLRERQADIPLLLNHFLEEAGRSLGKELPSVSEETIALLSRYPFPGNVRELKTMVHDAVSRNKTGTLSVNDFRSLDSLSRKRLPGNVSAADTPICLCPGEPGSLPTVEEATIYLIRKALRRFNNNQSMAAKALDISRQRLARHLKKRVSS